MNPYSSSHRNPYRSSQEISQPVSTPEEALERLHQTPPHQSPSGPLLQLLLQYTAQGSPNRIQWNLSLALDVSMFCMSRIGFLLQTMADSHSEKIATKTEDSTLLWFLASSMEDWTEDVMYAVLVHPIDNGNTPLFSNLLSFWVFLATSQRVQRASNTNDFSIVGLCGLSVAYEAMDRLQPLTSTQPNNTVGMDWWIEDRVASELLPLTTQTLLEYMLTDDAPYSSQMSIRQQRIQLAALSILCTVLKRLSLGQAMLNRDQMSRLCTPLLCTANTLLESQPTSGDPLLHLHCALSSLSILSLIQRHLGERMQEYNQVLQSSAMVETVVRLALFTTSTFPPREATIEIPRWIVEASSKVDGQYLRNTMICWNMTDDTAWDIVGRLDYLWVEQLKTFFQESFSSQHSDFVLAHLSTLALLYRLKPLHTKHTIRSIFGSGPIPSNDEQVRLCATRHIDMLCSFLCHSNFAVRIHAARCLCTILSDRRRAATDDDCCRFFWDGLSASCVTSIVTRLVELAGLEDIRQPFVLALSDLVEIILLEPSHHEQVLATMGVDNIEKLIHIMTPKEVRFDLRFPDENELSHVVDSDTPTANNLSRLDDRSICSEINSETLPRGIDDTVRVSIATLMAKLGYCSSSQLHNEESALLRGRLCSAVNDFLVDCNNVEVQEESVPINTTDFQKRSWRLKVYMSTPENEDFVAETICAMHNVKSNEHRKAQQFNRRIQQELDSANTRIKELEAKLTKNSLHTQSQTTLFKREISLAKRHATQEANQHISIHISQRKMAESQLLEASGKLEQKESQLLEATKNVRVLEEAMEQERTELSKAQNEAELLRSQKENLSKEVSVLGEQLSSLQSSLTTQTDKLDEAVREKGALETKLNQSEQDFYSIKEQYCQLKDNMEDIFADMLNLTIAYEGKEQEFHTEKESNARTVSQMKDQLHRERVNNDELSEANQQLQSDNNKLMRKLGKYKELLEEERQARQEEANRRKRNGPVSYINQLHDSMSESRSHDRSSKPSQRPKNHSDKENNYSASSSSYYRRRGYP
eukprot:Nitzschia sp. Nitz4//scaffold59_size112058//16711//19909//NITZ4_004100-RA/size112058-snap-gene-0.60-mRNA-1//-1//CDS//3329555096//465//frame0